MFLQGSAGTGKIFTVRTFLVELAKSEKRVLICGTKGIAVVQYPRGTTVHSLFPLGMDEISTKSFAPNVGKGTFQAERLRSADVIIIDDVSMLIHWVVQKVSLPLQSISEHPDAGFGGKRIPFVGDLLQLPPVALGLSVPILHKVITRLPCWP
jgi:hypothetical protein